MDYTILTEHFVLVVRDKGSQGSFSRLVNYRSECI